MSEVLSRPKWLRDIVQLLPIRAQFVLTGEIRDEVLIGTPAGDSMISFVSALWRTLEGEGFSGLLLWDMVDGLQGFPNEPEKLRVLSTVAGVDLTKPQPMRLGALRDVLRRVNAPGPGTATPPMGLVVNFASRLRDDGRSPDDVREFFVAAEKAALLAVPQSRGTGSGRSRLFNPVFWMANRPNDLPYWLTVDNERIRSIAVPLPDADTRERAAMALWKTVGKKDIEAGAFSKLLASLTDNLSLGALKDVVSLTNRLGLPASDVADAVQSYRVGDLSLQSPWRGSQLRDNIRRAEAAKSTTAIANRVLGQGNAVVKVLDILKRTSIGLTGAQSSGTSGRPRGVLFFVGPTGVGKTEMAKTIAKIVFGDEKAVERFDMSEFSAEHSGDRLIGAPPGYTGFDQGGELTNALRERPFRVLLFDEIEKAHHRILDKFLQVLEDGRLTDGRGETVYFSEALIVFTSNLGVSREMPDGTVQVMVSPDDPPKVFEAKLLEGIHDYFKRRLQRPELLNRIGENIVVFHYITPEVGQKILDLMLGNVRDRVLEEHRVRLEIDDHARTRLGDLCVGQKVENGGRGIGSKLEAVLINPLARLMFDREPGNLAGGSIRITGIDEIEGGYALRAD